MPYEKRKPDLNGRKWSCRQRITLTADNINLNLCGQKASSYAPI